MLDVEGMADDKIPCRIADIGDMLWAFSEFWGL